ncbi:endonuclease/exonuclease/phosphatase family protein [Nitratireductor mangrovi]|uniref:Endonuclease/exonuclease/phosphatase family protein n=1 Tax=Nitratireductor mangrovi TaxID=2599600 RepID=A0A5B8KYT2_9HYPH|nr:endonuclease/exonuclease/phosphatase family protein [Nitratireductor mangrovi]QDZ00793.1 endonuclease/exonuclease/phosphatase family protein [Nitratireductor mangrovi]
MTPSVKTQIRLITWNCAGNFQRKSAIIAGMRPDVVLISEAEEDAADALPDTSGGFWIGTGRRGLAVVALNGWCIEPAEVQIAERLFLPVRLSRGDLKLHVVGTCVKKTTDYVGPTLSALEQLGGFLRAGPGIVAGDFNQSVALDERRTSGRRFARVIERLDELRFRSAWHYFKDEQMGAESKPTLFGDGKIRRRAISISTTPSSHETSRSVRLQSATIAHT